MPVFWTMIFYVMVVGLIGRTYVTKSNIKKKYDNKTTIFFAILIFILPLFFIGLRTNFADTAAHIKSFNQASSNIMAMGDEVFDSSCPLWNIYIVFFKQFISSNANAWLMVTAILSTVGVIKFFYKYSTDYSLSVYIFFCTITFTYLMNGIRQFFALSLLLFFADYIFKNKFWKFLVVLVIAFFIHQTIIIWLPVYFIVKGKPWSKKILFTIALTVLIVAFANQFTNLLDSAIEGTYYSNYSGTMQSGGEFSSGASIYQTLILLPPVIIALWKRKQIAAINNRNVNIMINISVISVAFMLIANFTSGILMGRIPTYFSVFSYALIPWELDNLFYGNDKKMMKILCYAGYFLAFCVIMLIQFNGNMYESSILGMKYWGIVWSF